MQTAEELRALLRRMDGRSYGAYRSLRGAWALGGGAALFVDRVQGDPFAAPSRMRLRLDSRDAGWPAALWRGRVRRIAFEDWLARRVAEAIAREVRGRRGSGKSGRVFIDAGGQAVLERSAAQVEEGFVEARLEVGLPAAGRRVLGREAEELLAEELPRLAAAALPCSEAALREAQRFADCAENHAALQAQLTERGLAAFVADGAVLPRESGASQRPLRSGAVPFRAPDSLRVTLDLPNAAPGPDGEMQRAVSGLGIPLGVTLIVGGGYHGKSTLLQTLERAVHPHIPGDGRECCAALPSAVKIRAEDGRRVVGCDIHGFIRELPQGRSTAPFHSDDASGSTSQAANIVEALEAGAKLLLLDEDSSATNFMVRDARMQALVHRDFEPITPFVDRVRELHEALGVSTILVMGGCGDYFEVADTTIEMRDYAPRDVSAEARRIATAQQSGRVREARAPLRAARPRAPLPGSIDAAKGRREVRIDVRGRDGLGFGEQHIDLRAVEQIVEPSQVRAIGYALHAARRFMTDGAALPGVLDELDALLDSQGLDALARGANLARPRRFEIAAALGRLRSLRVAVPPKGSNTGGGGED
ncbi:MAG: ABC-ATPase domain-containing protein [Deltaproteobacteria bacterium]|nr:ABC-ATPase domain-containing protein [Deltaproteobacteria bacterium]